MIFFWFMYAKVRKRNFERTEKDRIQNPAVIKSQKSFEVSGTGVEPVRLYIYRH